MLSSVSLVVPSYNRPGFVRRLLTYHSQSRGLQIILGDGSDPQHLAENKEIIAAFGEAGMDIIHYTPDLPAFVKPELAGAYGLIERMVNGARLSTREFVNICGDDDFVSPQFMTEAAVFLKEHPDYSAAIGYMPSAESEVPGPVGRIVRLTLPPLRPAPRSESSAAARIGCDAFLPNNALDFAFFRRDVFEIIGESLLELARAAQDPADPTPPRVTAFTLLYLQGVINDHVALSLGKVHWLPRLQLGRHLHTANYGRHTASKANLGDSVVAPHWPRLVAVYLDAVTNAVMRAESVDRSRARRIAEGGLALRMSSRLAHVGRQRLEETVQVSMSPAGTLRKTVRTLPGARQAWRATYGFLQKAISHARSARLADLPSDVQAMKTFLEQYR